MANQLTSRKALFRAYQQINERRAAAEEDKGFTLIELLIVVVVLGILAAVVVFALGGVTGKSAQAACEADGNTISTAMAAFAANNPGVAPTEQLLTGSTNGGPYIQSWPSNLPHYAYAIVGGVLVIEFPGTAAWVADPTTTTSSSTTTTTGVSTSTTSTTFPSSGVLPYEGAISCSSVS